MAKAKKTKYLLKIQKLYVNNILIHTEYREFKTKKECFKAMDYFSKPDEMDIRSIEIQWSKIEGWQ